MSIIIGIWRHSIRFHYVYSYALRHKNNKRLGLE